MKMVRVDDLALFVRTAALGSFSNAAREADLLPGQVAAAVARLERELDLRLFVRSTRSLRLTAEGALYLPYAQDVLATLSEGQARVRGEDAELRGVLQVAAPSDLGRHLLLPWLTEFRATHPKLQLRLRLSDQVADVFRDPVDIAFRLGRFDDASYVALPLLPGNRRVLAAAPGYLARHGTPTSLEALKDHHCLLYQLAGRAYDRWNFEADGRRVVVPVRGNMICDDADVLRREGDPQRTAGIYLNQPDSERLAQAGQNARRHRFQRALRRIRGHHDKLIAAEPGQDLPLVKATQNGECNRL